LITQYILTGIALITCTTVIILSVKRSKAIPEFKMKVYSILTDLIKSGITGEGKKSAGKNIHYVAKSIIHKIKKNFPVEYITILMYTEDGDYRIVETDIENRFHRQMEPYINTELLSMKTSASIIEARQKKKKWGRSSLGYPSAKERCIYYSYLIPLKAGEEKIGAILFENSIENKKNDKWIKSFKHEELFNLITEYISILLQNLKYFQTIECLALIDGLTGVYNKIYMYEYIEEKMIEHRRKGEVFSVTILDIDHFKKVNDTYGHLFGDWVLKVISRVIKENLKKGQSVYRFGGEEFVIYLPQMSAEEAYEQIDSLREIISKTDISNKDFTDTIRITSSFGISEWPRDSDNLKDIIKIADEGLYKAKKAGRNKVIISRGNSNGYN
jgi:diguanylate cyclase (GGDEF)-like protein